MQNDSNLPNLKASNAVSTDNVWPNPSAKPRFHILYELGPTIVINKQPGVLTQARMGVDSLEARVKEFMNQRENRSGKSTLGFHTDLIGQPRAF